MKKRLILIALTAIMAAAMLTVFVACNPNDGDELIAPVDEGELMTVLDKAIGYVSGITSAEDKGVICTVYSEDCNFGTDTEWWNGMYAEIVAYWDIGESLPDGVEIFWYDSEQSAANALQILENDGNGKITQHGSLVVYEHGEGQYEALLGSSIPRNITESDPYKFCRNAFAAELRGNNLSMDLRVRFESGDFEAWSVETEQKTGNREKAYFMRTIGAESELEDMNELIQSKGTEDSYAEIKNVNGKTYIQSFYQPKAGLYFEEYGEGQCNLTDIYFDGSSITIPVYHDGKLVACLDWFPNGVTDVYYDGTVEQWNAIQKIYQNAFLSKTIHCSDGVIEKTADGD